MKDHYKRHSLRFVSQTSLMLLLVITLLFISNKAHAVLPDGSTAPNWTLTDLDGNTHTLYDILDEGKMVAIDFSATWCPPCWSYHNSGVLETLYEDYGPDGTDELMVFFIEPDQSTNLECLYGPNGCVGGTEGDWVTGTPYPIINTTTSTVGNQYNVTYYPTLYAVCPNRVLFEAGQASLNSWLTWLQTCEFDGDAVASDVLCAGEGSGTVDLSPTGGYGNISYSWSNGENTQDLSGLEAGEYFVTMTEGNGYMLELGPFTVGGPQSPLDLVTNNLENVDCAGNQTGAIDISPTGGTPGYSVLWSTGSNNNTVTGLGSGDYTVTLTDNNNCTETEIYTITEPTALTVQSVVNDENCGNSDGEIIAQGAGGSPTYSYDIGFGPESSGAFTDLSEGVYYLSITDANGCMEFEEIILLSSQSPTADAGENMSIDCSSPEVMLNGTNSSGGPNIIYFWSTIDGNIVSGESTTTPTIDAIGNYELQVYNTLTGCEEYASTIVIGDVTTPDADAGPAATLTCTSSTTTLDGSGSQAGSGISYLWSTSDGNIVSGGDSTSPVVDASGTYTLLVTDNDNGCSAEATTTVSSDANIPNASANASTVLNCSTTQVNLDGNGSSSGTEFSYSWSTTNGNIVSGETTLTPTVDQAGSYTILVTNNDNGCTSTASATVSQSTDLPDADAGSPANLTCTTSSLTLDGSNSESGSNITYQWSTSDGNIVSGATSTSPVIDAEGTYTLTVSNSSNGCTAASTVSIASNTSAPNSDAGSAEDLTCSNNSSTLDGSGSSSGSNISYQWSTSNGNIVSGATTTSPVVDEEGTYSLLVTNNDNGCTSTASVAVANNTDTPTANAGTGGQLTCATTTITLDGSDSSAGAEFSYSWTTTNGNIVSGEDTDSPVVDEAGSYALIVTNNDNGCTASATAVVSQNGNLPTADAGNSAELNCNSSVISLNGNNSSGGSNIEYQWSTNDGNIVSGEDSTTPSVDEAGTYTLLVTNTANGCSSSSSVTVDENLNTPTADAGNADQLNCNNNTVSLDGTDSSSGSNIDYEWSTNDGNIASGTNTATPTVDEAGTYTLLITNTDNGCTNTAEVTITETEPLAIELSSQSNALCQGDNNASATVTVEGGNGPYNYDWPSGGDEATEENLSAGVYVATVTDDDNCMQTISVTITEPTALSVNATATNETASNANNGTASVMPEGGQGNYTYSWSNGATTASVNNLEPGLYTVEVTDENNCTSTETVTVNSFNCLVTASISGNDVNCFDGNNGSASATLNGGTAPYTYEWSNGETTASINNLSAGTYEVTISDNSNCPATALITIGQPIALSLSLTASTEVLCAGMANGSATVEANGGDDNFSYSWSNGATGATVNNLNAGAYSVTASDGNQCSTTLDITVTEPSPLTTSIANTDETLAGADDGTATANPSGGITPYSYLWSNGATTATATDLAPGTYNVIITDGSGCTTTASAVINGVSCSLQYNVSSNDVNCFEGADGNASVSNSGNSYNYNWSTGATTASVSDLPAGIYQVSISDDNGCESIEQVTITQPLAIEASLSVTAPNCAGANDGVIDLSISGGNGNFTYLWQDGSTAANYNNAGAGQFSVTVTDMTGCTQMRTITVDDPTALTATITSTNTSSATSNDGTAMLSPSGGNGTYSFLWSNGATTQNLSDLAPGPYTVVITDGNGCTTTETTFIQGVNCALNSNITNTNITCASDANGTATISILGGTGTFQYLWSNSATTQTINGLTAGTYTVTATDMLGCSIFEQVTITEPIAMTTASISINQPSCNGQADGTIQTNTTGGSGGYTFLWSDGSSNANLTDAPAGDYTLTVTDANGCSSNTSYSLTAPTPVSTSIVDQSNVQCGNDGTGTAMAMASGGTGTISFLWSNGQTSETATDLNAGTYTVVATDANGCSNNSTVTIMANDNTPPIASTQDVTIALDAAGLAVVAPNQIDASSSDNCEVGNLSLDIESFDCSNIGDNIVQFTVTDGAGNTSMMTAMVTVIDNVEPIITCDQNLVTGNCSEIVNYALPTAMDNCSSNQPELLIGLGSGAIFPVGESIEVYRVTDESGNSATCSFTVMIEDTEAPEISCPANIVIVGCDQEVSYTLPTAADACSTVGTPTLVQGLGTGAIFPEGLTTEVYEVADAAGNMTTCSFTIEINNTIDGSISELQNTCFDSNNGMATVAGNGGQAPYSYDWDNGQTGPTATDLGPDLYAVIITDANGCSNEVFVTISTNPEITNTLDLLQDESGMTGDGAISITSNGGSGIFIYEWTSNTGYSSNEEDIDNLSAGTYTCVITDDEGCSITAGPFVVGSVSGLNDPAFAALISLYPNPTDGALQIHLNETLSGEDIQFEVFSITGQEIGTSVNPTSNNSYTLDISNQVNGIYLVKIRLGDEVLVKRIILNKD